MFFAVYSLFSDWCCAPYALRHAACVLRRLRVLRTTRIRNFSRPGQIAGRFTTRRRGHREKVPIPAFAGITNFSALSVPFENGMICSRRGSGPPSRHPRMSLSGSSSCLPGFPLKAWGMTDFLEIDIGVVKARASFSFSASERKIMKHCAVKYFASFVVA